MRSFFQNLFFLVMILGVIPEITGIFFPQVVEVTWMGVVLLCFIAVGLLSFLCQDYLKTKFCPNEKNGVFLFQLFCFYFLGWLGLLVLFGMA